MASTQMKERLQAAEDWILSNSNPPQTWPWTWLYKSGRSAYALIRDVIERRCLDNRIRTGAGFCLGVSAGVFAPVIRKGK